VKQPSHGPYADSSFWFADTGYPEFDPDGAKALVDEYTAEKGSAPEIDYIGIPDPFVVQYMELLQSMWADSGIKVNVVSQAQAENIGAVLGGTFQMAGWSGIGGDDPDNDYKYFHSSGLNITGYTSATMDAAMDAGRATPDADARKAEYAKVQQELTDNLPFIWMGSNQWAVVADAKVNGIASFTLPDGSLGRPLTGPRFFAKDIWISE
jgi:peptide/nickel transport system substrate-binding protein